MDDFYALLDGFYPISDGFYPIETDLKVTMDDF